MKQKFIEIFKKYIDRAGADELLKWLESTDFFEAPASTRFHGDHPGGLVEHSVNVFNELVRLLRAYPEVKTTGETAAIVALLHDVCKANVYKVSTRNKKDENGQWVQVPFYEWDEKFSFGAHGAKSMFLVQKFMALTDEEAVAICNHMGFSDRPVGDYTLGSAYESYPLAWLLHVADEAATYICEGKKGESNGK